MRNPNRIDRILDKYKRVWKAMPDLRFTQLYVNMLGTGDYFYLEDDKFEKKLDELIEQLEK